MGNGGSTPKPFGPEAAKVVRKAPPEQPLSRQQEKETEQGIFAAGCFWGHLEIFARRPFRRDRDRGGIASLRRLRSVGVQLAFQRVPGVVRTTVGYTMGRTANPSYEDVCSGQSGHTEAVCVVFRKAEISYGELLTVLWDRMDPTALNRQGNDTGTQYRSGIYFLTNEQRDVALKSRDELQEQYDAPIATEILPAQQFWPAEDYHQAYLSKLGQTAEKGRCDAIRCYG